MGNLEDLNGFAFADQEYLSLRPILANHMLDKKKYVIRNIRPGSKIVTLALGYLNQMREIIFRFNYKNLKPTSIQYQTSILYNLKNVSL